MKSRTRAALALGALLGPAALDAAPVPRPPPVSGTIIRTRSGETAELVPARAARRAEVLQKLKAGDVLRTNANGTLALVFADQTQIRLGRNAVLVVREVKGGQPSVLQLQRGRIWGRSPSGKARLSVQTPSATAAIRGTEWSLSASDESTALQVFEGAVDFFNDAGSLAVAAGQAASARPGQAPVRTVLVNREGREQMLYFLSREEGLALLSGSAPVSAAYRGWFEALSEGPEAVPPALDEADPYSFAGRAFLAAWQGDLPEGLGLADRGLRLFPDSSVLREVKARIALLQGDGKLAAETVAEALRHDPDDAAALALRAEIALNYLGEPYAALADARRAVREDRDRPQSWATLADVRLERDSPQEAAAAIERAIAIAPNDAGLHARRAFILLRQNRLRAARKSIDRALAIDPGLSIVRTALARYYVQTGHSGRALDELLAASADNPGYARALIALAETYYRAGDEEAAIQQLDAADRLDPASPLTPLARTAIALDRYAADDAIIGAREAMRRFRARGGVYANLSENRTTGSYVSEAFRFLGLEGWGRYYGDRVFDSFTPSSYFDQALNQTPSPFIQAPRDFLSDRVYRPFDTQSGEDLDSVSSFIQGLLLDPLSVTGSERTPQFSNERFLEAHAGARLYKIDRADRTALFGGVDGILHTPVPFGFSLDFELAQEDFDPPRRLRSSASADPISATGYFGAELGPANRLVLFGSLRHVEAEDEGPGFRFDEPIRFVTRSRVRTEQAFGFLSHSFGARNQLTVGGGLARRLARTEIRSEPLQSSIVDITRSHIRDSFELLSLAYARGIGRLDLKAGVELIRQKFHFGDSSAVEFDDGTQFEFNFIESPTTRAKQQRYYADARLAPRGNLQLQGHIAVVRDQDSRLTSQPPFGSLVPDTNLDLRLGIAWEPGAGHWLRLALGRNTPRQVPFTIAPSTTLGLRENLFPAFFELLTPTELADQSDSLIARWDAEWSPHLFTAIEYQHQGIGGLPIASPDAQTAFFGEHSRIDRITASANIWATGNIGIRLSGALTRGRTANPRPQDGETFLPFLPGRTAQAGLTWTHASRISARLVANYIGPQRTIFGARLGDYVIANAAFRWEPLDKRLELRLDVFNLLATTFRTSDIGVGPGRAVSGSVLVRF